MCVSLPVLPKAVDELRKLLGAQHTTPTQAYSVSACPRASTVLETPRAQSSVNVSLSESPRTPSSGHGLESHRALESAPSTSLVRAQPMTPAASIKYDREAC